jgi:Myb-like DNA-binding protein FlbD
MTALTPPSPRASILSVTNVSACIDPTQSPSDFIKNRPLPILLPSVLFYIIITGHSVVLSIKSSNTTSLSYHPSDLLPTHSPSPTITHTTTTMLAEPALNKRNWEGKEDMLLLELYAAYGSNWTRIAGGMGIRSAKQCRERYTQHLKPGLNRTPISEEEGRQIMRMVAEYGQRWAQIARNLGTNRSDNQIKNWWNGAKRKETSKRQEANQDRQRQQQQQQSRQQPQTYPVNTSPALPLPERRGILPPVPLDLPYRHDDSTFEAAAARSRSSYESDRPPSLISDNGSTWSMSRPASASCSPVTLPLPPLLYSAPPPTPPAGSCLLPPPTPTYPGSSYGPGPIRRSSEVMSTPGAYSPQSRYISTAPTTPVGRGSSSRWEPYPTARSRRPSSGYHSYQYSAPSPRDDESNEKKTKTSLSFLLN